MAELVEWQHVERGDVVKLNRPGARWLMVRNIDQQWEPHLTRFDYVDVDGTHSHVSRPKREVIRRKLGASVYDQHREAVLRVLAEREVAETNAMSA